MAATWKRLAFTTELHTALTLDDAAIEAVFDLDVQKLTLASQAANTFLRGPTTPGAPAADPVFGPLVNADLPATAINAHNLVINGNFNIWQRGNSLVGPGVANNDDVYTADGWNLLSDGNDIVDISGVATSPPSGSVAFLQGLQATANKQWGLVTFLEKGDSVPLAGKTVSLSFQAKTTAATIGQLRAAILSWASTADVVTSDVVATWHGGGTNPDWAANWTMENVPADLALTTSWQTFKIENVAIDTASMANVAVVIWVDDTNAAANDIVQIAQVQLEIGPAATAFAGHSVQADWIRCQRYYERLGGQSAYELFGLGQCYSTTGARVAITYTRKRGTAVPDSGGSFSVSNSAWAGKAVTNVSWVYVGRNTATVDVTVASGLVAGDATGLYAANDLTAYIALSAEL